MPNDQQKSKEVSRESAGNLSRRDFLAAGAGSLALTVLDNGCDSHASQIKSGTHHIPPDKGLDPNWVERPVRERDQKRSMRATS